MEDADGSTCGSNAVANRCPGERTSIAQLKRIDAKLRNNRTAIASMRDNH
jgi:hypothetical protein